MARSSGNLTPGTRLKMVRDYLGLGQKEFGLTIGQLPSGVSQIENGKDGRTVTLEIIERVRTSYNIDPRWFFGMIERLEDADLTKQPHKGVSTTENLAREIIELRRVVLPAKDFDPLAHRVMVKPELKKLVAMVANLEDHMVRKIHALVYGYLQRDQEAAQTTNESKESARAAG